MTNNYLKPNPNDTIGRIAIKLARYLLLAIAVTLSVYAIISLLFGVLPEAEPIPRAIAAVSLGSIIGYGILVVRQKDDGKNDSGMLEPDE